MSSTDELKKLKIAELRKELTDRGLSSKGNKAELLLRLTEYLDATGAEGNLDNDEDPEAVLTADDEAEDLLNPDVDLEDGDGDPDGDDRGDGDLEDTRKVDLEPEEKTDSVEVKKIAVQAPKSMTDVEKKALRAQKFGVSAALSDADRKKARAERFGTITTGKETQGKTEVQSKVSLSVDAEKLKQRAERFGKSVSPTAVKNEEAERIRKRKERFGVVTAATGAAKAKISISGDDDVEAKKRKRSERFGMA